MWFTKADGKNYPYVQVKAKIKDQLAYVFDQTAKEDPVTKNFISYKDPANPVTLQDVLYNNVTKEVYNLDPEAEIILLNDGSGYAVYKWDPLATYDAAGNIYP